MLAPGWRSDKHRAHWLPMLEKYAKPLYGKPVNKIDTDDVVRVLTPLWHEQPDLARRLRERIQRVLNWTTAKGMRQGKNPAAWEGNLQDWMSKPVPMQVRTKHMRALPYDDIPAFMTRLRALDRLGARALEFTVLTAARTGETLGATWTEINFEQALWIVPGERMKMRLPHTVPLSERALQIVKDQHAIRSSQLVFRGLRDNRPLSNSAMLDVLEGLGVDVTVHGFRSSFSDWAGDKMAARFPCELVQLALAHAIGNTTDRAYRRTTALEQRRELMNAWATYCERPPETDNIIQMEYPFPPRMG